jgi:hypothetical protein
MDTTEIPAPGLARLERCPECDGSECLDCQGTGILVWRACVRCGDVAMWEPVLDSGGLMLRCRLCGERWSKDDPRWLAQRVPDQLLAINLTSRFTGGAPQHNPPHK